MDGPVIGIDARKLRDYGIGRYIEGLLHGLAELDGPERWVLFLSPATIDTLPGDLDAKLDPSRFVRVPCSDALYAPFALRGAAKRHALDLLHFPHWVRPLAAGCPVALSIHDAIHLSHPPRRGAHLLVSRLMPAAARSARALFTGSNASRDELARRLRLDPGRFRVTPYGAGPGFAPPGAAAAEEFRGARGLSGEYVLCVASHRPHKNLAGAIEGFRRAGLPGATLVVPARDAAAEARLAAIISGEPSVRVLAGLRDEELPCAYAAARIVLVPSLAEGFGLPALEAAACGAAVLASDVPSHAEVLGAAAARFDPREPSALAAALTSLWTDGARRRSLAAAGPERAKEFTWLRTARLTVEGYRAALR